MGNCYVRRQQKTKHKDSCHSPYVDKTIHSVYTIGVKTAIHKSDKKIGVETDFSGRMTKDSETKYIVHDAPKNDDESSDTIINNAT